MRFERDQSFDLQFDKIEGLRWYPHVGKQFSKSATRIMVFAHNIPIPAKDYDAKLVEWQAKDTWATSETIEEYTYCRGWWTKTFRAFLKGAVGLTENFDENSDSETIEKIEKFVRKIAYINFIQGLVKSDRQIALAEREQVELSKKVNREILKILEITHCICWGKPVYEYVRGMAGFKVLSDTNLGKNGFSSCLIDVGEGRIMHCLRVYHPSMPSFDALGSSTHGIIARFLNTEVSVSNLGSELNPCLSVSIRG